MDTFEDRTLRLNLGSLRIDVPRLLTQSFVLILKFSDPPLGDIQRRFRWCSSVEDS
jgi:hypothetical protein